MEISSDEGTQFHTGDFIIFYAIISDIYQNKSFLVAQYKPDNLGDDDDADGNGYDYLNDIIFIPEFNQDLIFYLTQVLEPDPNQFILTLGMEFFCEDNGAVGSDGEYFKDIYIKACNFSFSYKKLINRESVASFIYEGDEIDDKGGKVEIIDSKLNFDYKINNRILKGKTPNSEIKAFINNKEHTETIKLRDAETSFDEAKKDGLDVTELIPDDDDIDVKLQFYIGDDFTLINGELYVISIDNVELVISYDIYLSAEQSIIFQILLIIGIVVLSSFTAYMIYYQKVLKYPKPISKLRKYRKTLKRKNPPNIIIISRQGAFNSLYKKNTKFIYKFLKVGTSKKLEPENLSKVKQKPDRTKNKYVVVLLILILSLQFLIPVTFYYNQKNVAIKSENKLFLLQIFESQQWLRESHEKQWIKNSEFDNSEDWRMKLTGDINDINAEISNGEANYKIVGNRSQISWDITDPTNNGWGVIENEYDIQYPDTFEITENGWHVKHDWHEDVKQLVKAQWQKNFSLNALGINLNDYSITSASLEVWINASVDADGPNPIDRPGDSGLDLVAIGDTAEFFMLISDEERNRVFKVASYQDQELGKDNPIPITNFTDTILTPITEESLIYYLNQILKDSNNFSLIVGIQVWCEDNEGGDDDEFTDLYLKNLSLSLTFDKKISKSSSISWIYEGKEIKSNGKKVEIKDASLNFDYKINNKWQSEISPNSEIRIFINDEEHSEAVKLTEVETYFDEIKEDGFEVTDLIPDDEEIELEIQVYIADNMILDDEFIIYIDNVKLEISYDLITITDQMILLPFIIGIIIALGGLIGYFIYYRKVLRYPKPVRKVRKYRKTLKKERRTRCFYY